MSDDEGQWAAIQAEAEAEAAAQAAADAAEYEAQVEREASMTTKKLSEIGDVYFHDPAKRTDPLNSYLQHERIYKPMPDGDSPTADAPSRVVVMTLEERREFARRCFEEGQSTVEAPGGCHEKTQTAEEFLKEEGL